MGTRGARDLQPRPPHAVRAQGGVLTCHQAPCRGAHPRLGIHSRPGRQQRPLVAVGARKSRRPVFWDRSARQGTSRPPRTLVLASALARAAGAGEKFSDKGTELLSHKVAPGPAVHTPHITSGNSDVGPAMMPVCKGDTEDALGPLGCRAVGVSGGLVLRQDGASGSRDLGPAG